MTRKAEKKRLPLPPGPPRHPILGNILNNPITRRTPWKEYAALSQKYGDIMSFNVLGQSIIVLSSAQAVADIFEKRSAIYSNKPQTTMIHDLLQLTQWFMSTMPYGERWRRTRRTFHQYFHSGVVSNYQDVQLTEARAFLRRLKATPDDFFSLIRLSFASVIMKIMYDVKVKDLSDPYVHMAGKGLHGLECATQPGRYLADAIPIMKYIPPWFPGAHFRRSWTRPKVTFFKFAMDRSTLSKINLRMEQPVHQ